MERLRYYIDLLATLCGFDSPSSISIWGIIVVVLATFVLIYAFYRAVYVSIWPGEREANHIKRRILAEEDAGED